MSETAARRGKMSSILSPGLGEYMCHFWNLCQWPSFMAKYGNFENQPLSRKPLLIQRIYAQFRRPGIERECMCNVWNFGLWQSWF